ncbi:MAG: histidine phosphatase family protein [Ferruginibacter sp.]
MRFIIMLILTALQMSLTAQTGMFGDKAKVYLVRHGEKDTGDDPRLTRNGNARAGELVRILREKNIRRIYVTEYRRTQETGDSLRIQMQIDTIHYLADTLCQDLLAKIKQNNDLNKPILIIGHSNTIPLIIRKLGLGNYPANNIPDDELITCSVNVHE